MSVLHPFPMSLYWGGKIEYENASITYDESTTSTATIIIRHKMSYEELVSLIYEHVGVEKNRFKLKITLYYEHRAKPKLAQIMSDASLDIMFFKAEKDEDFFAEVHIDLEKIQVPLEETIPSPSTNQDQQQKQKQKRQQQQPCFSDEDQTCYTLNPGPLIPDLLFMHQEHRAHALFHGTMDECQLKVRRCDSNFWQLVDDIPERVMCHIREAGFEGVFRCGHIQINHALITALVERWRPETHTFHFPTGEATVTLQDVQVLWGLQVDGDAVCWIDQSKTLEEWVEFCRDMMGFTPPVGAINKSRIYLRYLYDVLRTPLAFDASEEDFIKRARVYIMHMLGGNLLSDLSSSSVYLYLLTNLRTMTMSGQQSWGSAILACLYRRLCKASSYKTTEICGPLVLLQLWAWERLPTIRPIRLCDQIDFTRPYGARWNVGFGASQVSHVLTAYRDRLTSLRPDQFVWVPYSNYVLEKLPAYCKSGHAIWGSVTYLVCWEIVEPHLPNRVLRQFGMEQPIPVPRLMENHAALHKLTRAGRNNVNWMDIHRQYIDHWQCRLQHVENSTVINDPTCASVEYITWYRQRTVMYITNPSKNGQLSEGHQGNGGTAEFLMDGLCRVYHKSVDLMAVSDSRHAKYLAEIRDITSYYMQQTKGHQRMQVRSSHVIEQDSQQSEPPPQTQRTPRTVTRTRQGGRRRRSALLDFSLPDTENDDPLPINAARTRQGSRLWRSEVFDASTPDAENESPPPKKAARTRQGGRRRRSEVFDFSSPDAENEGPSGKHGSTTSVALVLRK